MSSMVPEILIGIALKSAAVAAVALALVLLLKRLPAAQRSLIAHLGLLAAAAMPLLVLFGPQFEVAGAWTRDAVAASATAAAGAPAIMSAAAPEPASPTAPSSVDAAGLLLLIWAAGAAFLAAGLGLGLIRLFRLQREAAVLTDREWLGALAQAQHRMGVKQGTALLRSERLGSPVSWGLLRPTIVLNAGALRSPDRADAILAHELAHVVRMDWLNLLVARIATALFWFNPLVWILARQAHELREEAADDVVLRGDVDGPDYAGMLVDFARGERDRALAAHGVAPGKGSLKRRLNRVLDGRARRDPARPVWVAAGLLGAAALAVPLAAFTPMQVRLAPAAEAGAAAMVPYGDAGSALERDDIEAGLGPAEEPALEAGIEAETEAQAVRQDTGDAEARARHGRLSPEALATMSLHGVTPECIAALERELPWVRSLSAGELSNLAIHDVTPEWVRGMRGVGYDGLSHGQVKSLVMHGVDAAYVRDLAGAGLTDLSVDQLVGLRIAGVDARYARRMESEGITDVDALRRSALIGPRPGRGPRSRPEVPLPPTATPPAPPAPPPAPPASR